MIRQARMVLPGVARHVSQRGKNRQNVFFVDDGRRACLSHLNDSAARDGWRVRALPIGRPRIRGKDREGRAPARPGRAGARPSPRCPAACASALKVLNAGHNWRQWLSMEDECGAVRPGGVGVLPHDEPHLPCPESARRRGPASQARAPEAGRMPALQSPAGRMSALPSPAGKMPALPSPARWPLLWRRLPACMPGSPARQALHCRESRERCWGIPLKRESSYVEAQRDGQT